MREKKIRLFLASLLGTAIMAIVGCGGDGNGASGGARAKLKSVGDVQELAVPQSGSFVSPFGEGDANSGLTIQSLEVPIRSITLENEDQSLVGEVYNCGSNTNDGCLVELTGSALEDLLSANEANIPVGEYSNVTVSNCKGEGEYTGYIKASGNIDSTTHYTKSGDQYLSDTPGDHSSVGITFSGCSNTYPIPGGVTIEEDQSVDVNLFFDLTHIAFFSVKDANNLCSAGGNSVGACSGSSTPDPTGPFVGVNYLDVAATVDSGEPTLELFLLQIDDGLLQRGLVGVMWDSNDQYIGGFTRSSWKEGTTDSGSNHFVTPIRKFSQESDGSYVLENYGGSADSSYLEITIDGGVSANDCGVTDIESGASYNCSLIPL